MKKYCTNYLSHSFAKQNKNQHKLFITKNDSSVIVSRKIKMNREKIYIYLNGV